MDNPAKKEIECKYCGCCSGTISKGRGPHAYEIKCDGCLKHYKWASKYDVEDFSLLLLQKEAAKKENEAIGAAKNGDTKEYYKNIIERDRLIKILEDKNERLSKT